jgi:hypothetical protein
MLLVLWPSYLKHGLLDVILLVVWPPYLKHGLYELYLFKIEHQIYSEAKSDMNCYLIA